MHLYNPLRLPSCRNYAPITRPLSVTHYQRFHSSPRVYQNEFPNHYETLGLPPTASAKDIKAQFYALSKKYHPDKNVKDATASQKFVKISEAYHTLGSAEKKGKYDRDFERVFATGQDNAKGSYSSASRRSGPAGGRPASGLSKRRTQFRGPPPSFYKQGEYGSTGAKRQAAQDEADTRPKSSSQRGGLGSNPEFEGTGGFSPGSESGFNPDPDLPYFDKASHRRTHDNLYARREKINEASSRSSEIGGPGALANALMVGGVMTLGVLAGSAIMHASEQPKRKVRKNRENG